jgi:hypothetical protein
LFAQLLQYLNNSAAVIYVVDMSDSFQLGASAACFHHVRNLPTVTGTPILLVLNKMDAPCLLRREEVDVTFDMEALEAGGCVENKHLADAESPPRPRHVCMRGLLRASTRPKLNRRTKLRPSTRVCMGIHRQCTGKSHAPILVECSVSVTLLRGGAGQSADGVGGERADWHEPSSFDGLDQGRVFFVVLGDRVGGEVNTFLIHSSYR